MATAVGSAALVAGATFAVTAFADTGEPDQGTSAAASKKDPKSGEDFFSDSESPSKEELEKQREQAKKKMDKADGAADTSGKSSTKAKEKEKKEKSSDDSGGSSDVPSGSPKSMAKSMLGDHGWGEDEFSCLDKLWEKESGWDPKAENASSGAYGIPQALPGSKMESSGSDWKTNPKTQIDWGFGYIEDRYGSPCEAWSFSQSNGHY